MTPPETELVAAVAIPGLVVVSEANRRDHWAVKLRRKKTQQAMTHAALLALGKDVTRRLRNADTIRVLFVRIGGKRLDSDNLVGAFKHVRDALAKRLQINDGSDRLKWDWPAQESGEKGIRIELRIPRDD